jgi:hypothetical protein
MKFSGVVGGRINIVTGVHAEIGGHVTSNMAAILKNVKSDLNEIRRRGWGTNNDRPCRNCGSRDIQYGRHSHHLEKLQLCPISMKFAGVVRGPIMIVDAEIGGHVTYNMTAIATILKNLNFVRSQ